MNPKGKEPRSSRAQEKRDLQNPHGLRGDPMYISPLQMDTYTLQDRELTPLLSCGDVFLLEDLRE